MEQPLRNLCTFPGQIMVVYTILVEFKMLFACASLFRPSIELPLTLPLSIKPTCEEVASYRI